jgi:hypothetical protein
MRDWVKRNGRVDCYEPPPLGFGLPFIEECQQILGAEGSGLFELAVLLAVEQLSFPVEDGKSRNAAIHRNFVLLHEILILVTLADIDVHDFEIGSENRSHVEPGEGQIENMAVVTPVGAKDDENPLMVLLALL